MGFKGELQLWRGSSPCHTKAARCTRMKKVRLFLVEEFEERRQLINWLFGYLNSNLFIERACAWQGLVKSTERILLSRWSQFSDSPIPLCRLPLLLSFVLFTVSCLYVTLTQEFICNFRAQVFFHVCKTCEHFQMVGAHLLFAELHWFHLLKIFLNVLFC